MNIDSPLPITGNTVLLIGNWSYKNLGDELILLGTVKLLLKQQKSLIISCYDPKRLQHFFSQYLDTHQITFIHELPKGFRSFFQWFKKGGLKELRYFWTTDTIILGGGEILTEENPSAYRYRLAGMRPFLLKKMLTKNIFGNTKDIPGNSLENAPKFFYIMGGVQIPTNPRRKKLFRFLLNHSTHLYLRDYQAIEEIKTFGYPNTDFFMDTSYFAYDWKLSFFTKRERRDFNHNLPYIVVNLNKNGEKFLPNLINDLQIYLKQGYTIYFVPVAKGYNTYYNDLQYQNILEQQLGTSIGILDWEENFEHFIQILKNADLVITTRLHLFLIASFLGVPTKVYPYQRKILKMQEVIEKVSNNEKKTH